MREDAAYGLALGDDGEASSSAEDLLRAVAAELGLGRAVEILAGGVRACS